MKTTKPNQFNYKCQYALMNVLGAVMPKMPQAMQKTFVALTAPRMALAEQLSSTMHVDRYDMIVDWGCLAQRTTLEQAR